MRLGCLVDAECFDAECFDFEKENHCLEKKTLRCIEDRLPATGSNSGVLDVGRHALVEGRLTNSLDTQAWVTHRPGWEGKMRDNLKLGGRASGSKSKSSMLDATHSSNAAWLMRFSWGGLCAPFSVTPRARAKHPSVSPSIFHCTNL